ncbi:hypothetical protein [Mannheimia pernigra]|uniref:hypothetical protein n=1 Tax=Mannheimia pernigra TaxID=111844 RepID=UPI0013162838|nr:hypothetical protein [Mannheimia pernigra]QHB18292.1 hypothetical protein GM695_09800 [Mannheimia pernigra]
MSNLVKVTTSSFFYTTSNFILLMYVSSELYSITQMNFVSAMTFSSPFILPIFFSRYISKITFDMPITRVMCVTGICSVLLTIAAIYSSGDYPILSILLLSLKGIADSVLKSNRIIVIKQTSEPHRLSIELSYVSSSQYIAGAIGAFVFYIYSTVDYEPVVLISTISLSCLAIVIDSLISVGGNRIDFSPDPHVKNDISDIYNFIIRDKEVFNNMLYLLVVCTIVQSWHNIMRIYFPVSLLELDDKGISIIQGVASTLIFAGAIIGGRVGNKLGNTYVSLSWSMSALMILIISNLFGMFSIILYATYIFIFEILYTITFNRILSLANLSQAKAITMSLVSLQMFSILVMSCIGGILMDYTNVNVATVIFVAIILGAIYISHKGSK